MSVAFTREEDLEATAADLPDRPVSPHANLVTPDGLAMIDAELAARWRVATLGKLPGHGINDPSYLQPTRPMSAIGG